jgi:uncharacterized protein YcgI (DUF1989 family)
MQEIQGGAGIAVRLRRGEAVRMINTSGTQVVDTWCLAAGDASEYLSVEHTRRMLGRLFPREGDGLYSNRRNILLRLERDMSGCRHDMLLACCDSWLYAHYGCAPGHANCRDNFLGALAKCGIRPDHVPNPVNFWMNVPVEDNDRIELRSPVSKPGDALVLRAAVDSYVVFSACPMDVTPVNGEARTPRAVHFELMDRTAA